MDFSISNQIMENVSKIIVGKKKAIELLMVGLIGQGHVLIEDVPGVGKTLLAKALAVSIGGVFKRVQFTPDLLPADVTGFNVFDRQNGRFEYKSGPVITNVLLADEINRTLPRTQACLLESMEERQITIDGETQVLPEPFFVLATQNPIEYEGTFSLPEAQLDRFLLKIHLGYPSITEEIEIMEHQQKPTQLGLLKPIATSRQITELQKLRCQIRLAPPVKEYIASMVQATRISRHFQLGASPRASIALLKASQALAAIRGREYVIPDDVKYLAPSVLSHRLMLTAKEELRGNDTRGFLKKIIDHLPVPINES